MDTFFPWFRKRKKKPVLPFVPEMSFTSEQWRDSAENRNAANRLFATPEFSAIFTIMTRERPSSLSPPMGAPSEIWAAHACMCAGYEAALQKLYSFTQENDGRKEELPMTFPPEE